MNIQNISEEKAREYAAKSMGHEEWLFSSLDDAFAPQIWNGDLTKTVPGITLVCIKKKFRRKQTGG